jgi:hypothetical protein
MVKPGHHGIGAKGAYNAGQPRKAKKVDPAPGKVKRLHANSLLNDFFSHRAYWQKADNAAQKAFPVHGGQQLGKHHLCAAHIQACYNMKHAQGLWFFCGNSLLAHGWHFPTRLRALLAEKWFLQRKTKLFARQAKVWRLLQFAVRQQAKQVF